MNVCICGLDSLFAFRYTIKFNACVFTGMHVPVGWLMTNGKGDKNRFQSQCTDPHKAQMQIYFNANEWIL